MNGNDSPGDKHPGTTDDSTETETPLADTLAAAQAEIERLERQSTADYVELDYADEQGRFTLTLDYWERGGAD